MEKFNPETPVLEESKPSPESSPPALSSNKQAKARDGSGAAEVLRGSLRPVEAIPSFPTIERRILQFWEETDAFRKRPRGKRPWSFLDGPKTANNPIGVHHAWGRTLKDLFQRYRSMRGYRLRWQNGFDCQGLWVEVEVEKQLGFESKRDIETFGVAEFVVECKKRVLRYASRIVGQSRRLGCWMDWDDTDYLTKLSGLLDLPNEKLEIRGPKGPLCGTPDELIGMLGDPEVGGSYFTLSDGNNYAIWAFLKRCHENGWVYKGTDVVAWCPRCSTAISEHEIATEGYRDLVHPSLYVRLPLRDRPGEYLLVWTTTPWTLTSNVAVAVNPDLTYVKAKHSGSLYYVEENLLSGALGSGAIVLDSLPGAEMEGWDYVGPYDQLDAVAESAAPRHKVILWNGVSSEEGTGLVHIAPGCGKEDFELGMSLGLPVLAPLNDLGVFVEGYGPFTGMGAAECADTIIRDLESRGFLFRWEEYSHRYPVCWRCESELVFRLVEEWFIAMDRPGMDEGNARTLRQRATDIAAEVAWIPSFGRQLELDWLANMEDWMISKKRYWGLALPIWECEACGWFDIIGGRDELRDRAIDGWDRFEGHSPHRPWIDEVRVECARCGAEARRVPDVGNPWLDAGIVPFSTLRYFSDREYWATWFPAELVCESLRGQFRNWFYALLTMSAVLENQAPFKVCLGHGDVKGRDGREMHSSLGNAIWFDEAVEEIGADVMRWMYCSTQVARDLQFSVEAAEKVKKGFLLPLWNAYRFFVTYAIVDGWGPSGTLAATNALDRWILSRLQHTTRSVTESLEEYDPPSATHALEEFVAELSRWYLRRSRRRFWTDGADGDKNLAYRTLWECLCRLAVLLAPFTPFLSEEIYQNIVRGIDQDSPESVHHLPWPEVDEDLIDPDLEESMSVAMGVAELGRAARTDSGIKLRQPLRAALVVAEPDYLRRLGTLSGIIAEELNVKAVHLRGRPLQGFVCRKSEGMIVGVDPRIDQSMRLEGLAREVIRQIQGRRKTMDLRVDQFVTTHYAAEGVLEEAIEAQASYIAKETLSRKLIKESPGARPGFKRHRIQGMDLWIATVPEGS